MGILNVNQKDFNKEINEGLVLVDFWAPWCGPCKMIGPALEEISTELGDKVKIVKVNVDENQQLAMALKIMSIPTLMVYKDNKLMEKQIGFYPKEGILNLLNKHM